MRRPRRGQAFWTATIAELKRSNETQEAFARRRGISSATLRGWLYRLRDAEHESVSLVPVRVIASTAPTARQSGSGEVAVVELLLPSGLCLRFPTSVDAGYVATLVARLG